MKLAFMGTPDFAVPALDALLAAGHEVAAVYCQPPRPKGRGHKESPSPIQRFAESRGLPVRTPLSLKSPEEQKSFADLGLEAAVVAAYGLLLPRPILAAPRLGCVNVHASLLPRWRGAAPIHRAILAGDLETGITIMQMDEGLDTGAMLAKGVIAIDPADTASGLHDRLAALAGPLLVETLAGLEAGRVRPIPQPDGATYAAKLSKEEAELRWSETAAFLERKIRAFSPNAWFDCDGQRIKALEGRVEPGRPDAPAGSLLDDSLLIACGEGTALRLLRLQRAGKAAMEADAFLRGRPMPKGRILCPASN